MTKKPKYFAGLTQIVVLAGLYFAAAELGLRWASAHPNVSPVWPPTGLAIAALLLLGYRAWPGILIGAFLANYFTEVPLVTAAGIAVGNTLEALTAVLVLSSRDFHNSLDRAKDVGAFLAVALMATMISATVGNLSLCLGHAESWTEFGRLWLTWWLGDLVGAVVIGPLILTWGTSTNPWLPKKRYIEAVMLLTVLALAATVTFARSAPTPIQYYPLTRLIVPFFLWVSLRLGQRGVTLATVILSAFAVWGTAHGLGPFVSAARMPNEALLQLQLFVGSNAITFLFLAAVVEERRTSAEALRTKEAQLELITEITPVLLTQCGSDLRYRFVNRAYAQMLGFAPEQIEGQLIEDALGAKAFAKIRPYVEKVLRGELVEFEAEIPYAQGPRFMRLAYVPEKDAQGKVQGWVASITDLTERKLVEEALRQKDEQLSVALEGANLGAWNYDIQTGAVQWSTKLETLHGLAPGSFGGTFTDFLSDVHPDDRQRVLDSLTLDLEQSSHHEIEYRIVLPAGSTRWVEGKGQIFRDNTGKALRMTGVCMDVTERKRAQEEREQLLSREQAARIAAEDASRTKDEFLATVSHELRTPLNAIVGWSSMLRAGRLDQPTSKRALEIIDRNARAQTQLIEDLLDVSRIITGKLCIESGPVDLLPIIEAAIDSVRPALNSKSITLDLIADQNTGPVPGDPDRLQQVIWNLLSNSVKFTPAHGRIEVRLQSTNAEAEIIVHDTGQGISEAFLPYVFDRFRQADGAITRQHGGLGLGLAIARHLVELHGGAITAESPGEGKGATFTVKLRMLPQQLPPSVDRGNQLPQEL